MYGGRPLASLSVARRSGTGDPRLPFPHKAAASQAPPSRGWHVASCRPASATLQSHPRKRHFPWMAPSNYQLSSEKPPFFGTRTTPAPGPSMLGAIFPEGPALFLGTFHARARFPGRSCAFQGDLPCWRPFLRKVLRFSGGPSMPGAIFPEGPAFFRGTFHARGRFPGRSCAFPGDLPCQEPFSRKVPVQVLLVCAISGHLERKTLVLLLVYTISGHLEQ